MVSAPTESLRRWWSAPGNDQRSRWLLEPALGLAFFLLWLGCAAVVRDHSDPSGVLLLATAIAVSRVSPGGALASGVFALALLFSDAGDYVLLRPAVLIVAGAVVFFASAAYGNRAARWIGLTGAIFVSITVGYVVLPWSGLTNVPSFLGGGFSSVALFLGGVQLVAGVLCGAWALGLLLRRRAKIGPGVQGPREAWLMGSVDGGGERAVIAPSGLIREITPRQFTIDVTIAVAFVALDMVTTNFSSVQSWLVLLTMALAVASRRLAPAFALALAWIAAIVQMLCGLDVLTADFAILMVLYASAAYGERLTKWAGLASAGVGALLATGYLTLRGGLQLNPGADGAFNIADGIVRFLAFFIAIIGVLGLAWTLGLLMRTWQSARASKRQASVARQEQKLAERAIVVEQERNRIARDMHDVVAHSLAVVIAQADGARYARAHDPSAVDTALRTISSTAREALGDVRLLLAQLRQDETVGPQPMLADLDRLVDQMRSAGLAITWRVSGDAHTLGSGAQLAAYRIIQEALTNALRHGDPGREVNLDVNWDPAGVGIIVSNAIRDTSADAANVVQSVGHGLPGMRERALLAGGSLHTEAADGCFTVTARIPAGRVLPAARNS